MGPRCESSPRPPEAEGPREAEIALVEELLQEALIRSRQRLPSPFALVEGAAGRCGLGERAYIDLELGARGREICQILWSDPSPLVRETLARAITDWVERMDGLDRRRNHFLKAFRQAHGFDRTAYAPQLLREYETGLERLNEEAWIARRAAAVEVLGRTGTGNVPGNG